MTQSMGRVIIGVGIAGVVLVLPTLFRSDVALTILGLMCVMAVLGLSYNMLIGETGLLSFGHAVYFGLGGFVAIHAMNHFSLTESRMPLAAIPFIGGLGGLLAATVFGWFSTKHSGTAFAMISLGIGELVSAGSHVLPDLFGGESGITTNRAKLAPMFGLHFASQIETYYLIASWALLCAAVIYLLTLTPLGRACNAVRENAERAEFIGYNPRVVRFAIFCLSGFFAGVAGALSAINFELMSVSSLSGAQSGMILLMTYVGGTVNFLGPVLGAILVTYLQIMLSDITSAWLMYFGFLFMFVILYLPTGLAGAVAGQLALIRHGQIRRLVSIYLLSSGPLLASTLGSVMLVELIYRVFDTSAQQKDFTIIGVNVMPTGLLPWCIGLSLLAAGMGLMAKIRHRLVARGVPAVGGA